MAGDRVRERSRPQQTLFVAEGMLYFLGTENVKTFFRRLASDFRAQGSVSRQPVAVVGLLLALATAEGAEGRHPLDLGNSREIESWDRRLKVEENIRFGDSPYYDEVIRRLPRHVRLLPRLFPPAKRLFQVTRVGFLPQPWPCAGPTSTSRSNNW